MNINFKTVREIAIKLLENEGIRHPSTLQIDCLVKVLQHLKPMELQTYKERFLGIECDG